MLAPLSLISLALAATPALSHTLPPLSLSPLPSLNSNSGATPSAQPKFNPHRHAFRKFRSSLATPSSTSRWVRARRSPAPAPAPYDDGMYHWNSASIAQYDDGSYKWTPAAGGSAVAATSSKAATTSKATTAPTQTPASKAATSSARKSRTKSYGSKSTTAPATTAAKSSESVAVTSTSEAPATTEAETTTTKAPTTSLTTTTSAKTSKAKLTTTTTTPAPVTTTTTPPAAKKTTTTSKAATTTTSSAAAAPTSAATGGGSSGVTQMTYNPTAGAMGSCGVGLSDSAMSIPWVAVNIDSMGASGPDGPPGCWQCVSITPAGGGDSVTAIVADSCAACAADNHLDAQTALFQSMGGSNTGTASGHVAVTWEFVRCPSGFTKALFTASQ